MKSEYKQRHFHHRFFTHSKEFLGFMKAPGDCAFGLPLPLAAEQPYS